MKVFLFLTFLSFNVFAMKSQIDILSEVIIEQDHVYLKDIVKNKVLPKDVEEIIAKIEIGETPKAGEVQKFTNYAISEIIRYNLKVNKKEDLLNTYQLRIPNVVFVSRKTNDITAKEVKAKIISQLQTYCESCEFEILNFKFEDQKNLAPGLSWKLSDVTAMPRGNVHLGVEIIRNQILVKKVFAQGNIRIFKKVAVLKRPLQPNTRIQQDDFEWQRRDVTFLNESFPSENEIVGNELSTFLNASEILSQKHIKRKFALQRGASVQVVIKNNGWRAQLAAVAQDNGYIGDLVKVQNPITKKIITGTVTAENTVEVQ